MRVTAAPWLPEGWLSPTEMACLTELARGKTVLEIGSFLGRSTVVLAQVATRVVAVDHHHGSAEHQEGGKDYDARTAGPDARVDTAASFLDNLSLAGVRDRVIPFMGTIETAGEFLAAERFDLAFVDGDHSRDGTLRAGAIAFRLLKPQGIVAFHDFTDPAFPGVANAVLSLRQTFHARAILQAGSIMALQRYP